MAGTVDIDDLRQRMGWLGRIVYISSAGQLTTWLTELGVPAASIRPLPIRDIVPHLVVDGPFLILPNKCTPYTVAFTVRLTRHHLPSLFLKPRLEA
jgi:hypothetical protein